MKDGKVFKVFNDFWMKILVGKIYDPSSPLEIHSMPSKFRQGFLEAYYRIRGFLFPHSHYQKECLAKVFWIDSKAREIDHMLKIQWNEKKYLENLKQLEDCLTYFEFVIKGLFVREAESLALSLVTTLISYRSRTMQIDPKEVWDLYETLKARIEKCIADTLTNEKEEVSKKKSNSL